MAKATGLERPDGRPVRQFGEDIVETGEPFSTDTLMTIRSMVSDSEPAKPPKHPSADKEPAANIPDTPAEQEPAPDPAPLPDPLPDTPEDDFALSPEALEAFAEQHLKAMQDDAAISLKPTPQPDHENKVIFPPRPAPKESWRRLTITEGAPGQTVRRALRRPRMLAIILLVGVALWRPWFIPLFVLVNLTALALFAVLAGTDRIAALASLWFKRLKKRDPDRAQRLLNRGNRLLCRVEWLADRLPPAWVQGFHVPDLDAIDAPPEDDAFVKSRFDRIAAEERAVHGLAKGT